MPPKGSRVKKTSTQGRRSGPSAESLRALQTLINAEVARAEREEREEREVLAQRQTLARDITNRHLSAATTRDPETGAYLAREKAELEASGSTDWGDYGQRYKEWVFGSEGQYIQDDLLQILLPGQTILPDEPSSCATGTAARPEVIEDDPESDQGNTEATQVSQDTNPDLGQGLTVPDTESYGAAPSTPAGTINPANLF